MSQQSPPPFEPQPSGEPPSPQWVAPPPPNAQPWAANPWAQPAPGPQYGWPNYYQPPRRSRKKFIVVGTIVALCIAGAAAGITAALVGGGSAPGKAATNASGKPPAAFCSATAVVDHDFSAFITSGGKSPSQAQLRQDGFNLGVKGMLAGNPYSAEVKQFSKDSLNGNVQATLSDLHQIEGQCGLPPSQFPSGAT